MSWRRANREAFNRHKKRNYAQTRDNAVNVGQRWTIDQTNMVLAHEISDRELAAKIGRSVEAIQVRRAKVKGGYPN